MTSQDTRMRSVLAQLELMSAIPARNYNANGSSDDDPLGRRPPGDYGYREYADWYGPPFAEKSDKSCRSANEREDCIKAAERELAHLRRGAQVDPDTIETQDATRTRMLKETEGWSLQDVAQSNWRVSVTIMRRLRVTNGRDGEYGLPLELATAPTEDLASRARAMKAAGMSLRGIALALGLTDKVQVQRLLKRAA